MAKAAMIPVGQSVRLTPIEWLIDAFGFKSQVGVTRFLNNFHIPRLITPNGHFFDMVALEAVLRTLMSPGGVDLVVSGADPSNNYNAVRTLSSDFVSQIRDVSNPVWTLMALIGLTHGHLESKILQGRLEELAQKAWSKGSLLKEKGTKTEREALEADVDVATQD